MAVVLKQFEAEYGFKSPGFTVDNAGNVVVRTITNTYTPSGLTHTIQIQMKLRVHLLG